MNKRLNEKVKLGTHKTLFKCNMLERLIVPMYEVGTIWPLERLIEFVISLGLENIEGVNRSYDLLH